MTRASTRLARHHANGSAVVAGANTTPNLFQAHNSKGGVGISPGTGWGYRGFGWDTNHCSLSCFPSQRQLPRDLWSWYFYTVIPEFLSSSFLMSSRQELHCIVLLLIWLFLPEFCPAHFCSCSLQRAPDDPSAPAWAQSRTPKLPIAHKPIKDAAYSRHKQKDTGKSEMMPETTVFKYSPTDKCIGENWWDASPCTGNSSVCWTNVEAIISHF